MPPANTSIRDRTPEFLQIAERLQRQQGAKSTSNGSYTAGAGAGPSSSKQSLQQQSEFTKRASHIGLAIHKVSAKLQKLAQLAKRTSMFDDPSTEIDELTGVIKQEIQTLKTAIAELERVSGRSRDENKQTLDHSHTVVDNLRARLKDTTLEFKEVLTLRTDNLKAHKNRRQLFTNAPEEGVTTPLLARQASGGRTAQNLFSTQPAGGPGLRKRSPRYLSDPDAFGPQQSQLLLQQQDMYSSSRVEAMHNVEATIVELGSIFNQLADLVAEQQSLVARIDENVDETLANVDSAKAQLLKYLNSISGNRWLALKVFGVLVVFLCIFIFLL